MPHNNRKSTPLYICSSVLNHTSNHNLLKQWEWPVYQETSLILIPLDNPLPRQPICCMRLIYSKIGPEVSLNLTTCYYSVWPCLGRYTALLVTMHYGLRHGKYQCQWEITKRFSFVMKQMILAPILLIIPLFYYLVSTK